MLKRYGAGAVWVVLDLPGKARPSCRHSRAARARKSTQRQRRIWSLSPPFRPPQPSQTLAAISETIRSSSQTHTFTLQQPIAPNIPRVAFAVFKLADLACPDNTLYSPSTTSHFPNPTSRSSRLLDPILPQGIGI
ncbi:hypothetical protein P171DRAFT_481827 [Karstenula rhodostoma CBS 690.94]|uniref:Uncharacterized protein n=1 Tax=Karstenula rhodostoma CBS 690.94 TaxID=1392251 RepID=A0A9P4PRE8_9PLEO|nr:hypothetical protein P171DRAFT_481827 [Karstenula rhodostoma CBS 690.94]